MWFVGGWFVGWMAGGCLAGWVWLICDNRLVAIRRLSDKQSAAVGLGWHWPQMVASGFEHVNYDHLRIYRMCNCCTMICDVCCKSTIAVAGCGATLICH